jgi:polysaccharide export outer membrane protein
MKNTATLNKLNNLVKIEAFYSKPSLRPSIFVSSGVHPNPATPWSSYLKARYCVILMSLSLIFLFLYPQLSNGQENLDDVSYKIGVGDVLEIVTWKEPDFSLEEVLVRSDGMITFPLLDDIKAAGRTTMALKEEIENRLTDYVSSPVVTVTLRTPAIEVEKFYILGEVVNTGEYELTEDLTVLQAFSLAGGFTEWASKKEIIVLRKENGEEKSIRVNYKNIIKGKDFSQNIKLQANDTIIVP